MQYTEKDVMIVRQSSLKAAIEFEAGLTDLASVLATAAEFEAWVLRKL